MIQIKLAEKLSIVRKYPFIWNVYTGFLCTTPLLAKNGSGSICSAIFFYPVQQQNNRYTWQSWLNWKTKYIGKILSQTQITSSSLYHIVKVLVYGSKMKKIQLNSSKLFSRGERGSNLSTRFKWPLFDRSSIQSSHYKLIIINTLMI